MDITSTNIDRIPQYNNNDFTSIRGLTGLLNMGNTCYLNSTLQLLNNIPKFREYFISKTYHMQLIQNLKDIYLELDKQDNIQQIAVNLPQTISYKFERLFRTVWENNKEILVFRPSSFKKLIGKKDNQFNNYIQQDAEECLRIIFQIIEDEIGYSADIKPDLTNDELCGFTVLDKEFDDIPNIQNMEEYTLRRSNLRLMEDNFPGIIKRYKQLIYLKNRYNKKYKQYSICDQLFTVGQIDTVECTNCEYKSHTYADDLRIIISIPSVNLSEDDIINKMKTIQFPFEIQQNSMFTMSKQKSNEDLNLNLNATDLDLNSDTTDLETDEEYLLSEDEDENNDLFVQSDIEDEDEEDEDIPAIKSFKMINVNTDTILNKSKANSVSNSMPNEMLEKFRRNRAIQLLTEEKTFTLEHCLDLTFTKEKLDVLRTCDYCKLQCEGIKDSKLWSLPEYIIIHLKRFDNYGNKNKQLITFNEQLDMSKYMDIDLPNHLKVDTNYSLIGIVNHTGSNINSGHYYSFCKNNELNKWFIFNDEEVSLASKLVSSSAYILVYEKNINN